MPTYDYVCETCQHQFEFSQSMKDKPLSRCPVSVCPRRSKGKGRVKRLLGTGAGLLFKGSGFYITDYRSESYKTAAKGDVAPAVAAADSAATPAKTEAKAETKSDTKPETKSETKTETKAAAPREGKQSASHAPKAKSKRTE
jgi:putative FmdB family regulatory protein